MLEQLWREFADLGPLETHALDSATEDAAAVADTLATRLAAGLLLA